MTRSEQVLALLGADEAAGRTPVLLPIEAKQKGPKIVGWVQLTWADTRTPEWVAKVNVATNTGVSLGPISGHLCTLDVDNEECGPEFLALNPLLAGSLRTRGKKGFQMWVWMQPDATLAAEGLPDYPLTRMNINHTSRTVEKFTNGGGIISTPFVCAEWRSGGVQSVIAGVHPDDETLPDGTTRVRWYQTLVEAPPVAVRFSDIKWPDSWSRPWDEAWDKIRAVKEAAGWWCWRASTGRRLRSRRMGR